MDNPRMGAVKFARVRGIALDLPGVSERTSHGVPCFFVGDSKPLCYYHDNHRGDGRLALWLPAPEGVQEEMLHAEPHRFFRPQTSARGHAIEVRPFRATGRVRDH